MDFTKSTAPNVCDPAERKVAFDRVCVLKWWRYYSGRSLSFHPPARRLRAVTANRIRLSSTAECRDALSDGDRASARKLGPRRGDHHIRISSVSLIRTLHG